MAAKAPSSENSNMHFGQPMFGRPNFRMGSPGQNPMGNQFGGGMFGGGLHNNLLMGHPGMFGGGGGMMPQRLPMQGNTPPTGAAMPPSLQPGLASNFQTPFTPMAPNSNGMSAPSFF
jgi:hypothetical protein